MTKYNPINLTNERKYSSKETKTLSIEAFLKFMKDEINKR